MNQPKPTTPRSAPEASASTSGEAAITKVLCALPISLAGDVWTFVDVAKHGAAMEATDLGVRCLIKSSPAKQGRDFLIPWSNVTAVVYTPPAPLRRLDPYGNPMGQVGATN
jgi:hypothetical protein